MTPVCYLVLVETESAFVLGRDVLDAFDRLEVLEATTEALLLARPLGPRRADARPRDRGIAAGI